MGLCTESGTIVVTTRVVVSREYDQGAPEAHPSVRSPGDTGNEVFEFYSRMQSKLREVIREWGDEFPNVEFKHGPSTTDDAQYVVRCHGFGLFTGRTRGHMQTTLRKWTDLRIVSVGTGPSRRGGESVVFLNLERKRGTVGYLKLYIQVALLCASFYVCACLISQMSETL